MAKDDVMHAGDQKRLLFLLPEVYSPSFPISKGELFAGRLDELKRIARATATRGQHAIIFGERGVGKTSLANLMREQLLSQGYYVVKNNCVEGDTFHSAWKRALSDVVVHEESQITNEGRNQGVEEVSLSNYVSGEIGPASIRKIIAKVGLSSNFVFIFDEFDGFAAKEQRNLFADAIKDLADNCDNVTLVLVGVGHNVEELIEQHASIDRNLIQIKILRMDPDELREIVDRACRKLGITIDPLILDLIVFLSQGLPHYTHLLGQECTTAAIEARSYHITNKHLERGIVESIKNSHHSVTTAYQKATTSPKKNNLFAQVLLACALSETDDFGYFAAAAVRTPLNKITKENYDIPNFSQHLDKFSSDPTRGPVLEKVGTTRRFRFKFVNPMLQPYVIMRGLAGGLIDGEFIKSLAKSMPRKRHDATGDLFPGLKI